MQASCMRPLVLRIAGFKSFQNASEMRFSHGLTCIVGRNGSGKSNIIDALCFVLGLKLELLRTKSHKELVHRGCTTATVQLVFAVAAPGAQSEAAGMFHARERYYALTRTVTADAERVTTAYTICDCDADGRPAGPLVPRTSAQVRAFLKTVGVDVDFPERWIVLQQRACRILSSPEELSKHLDILSGAAVLSADLCRVSAALRQKTQLQREKVEARSSLAPACDGAQGVLQKCTALREARNAYEAQATQFQQQQAAKQLRLLKTCEEEMSALAEIGAAAVQHRLARYEATKGLTAELHAAQRQMITARKGHAKLARLLRVQEERVQTCRCCFLQCSRRITRLRQEISNLQASVNEVTSCIQAGKLKSVNSQQSANISEDITSLEQQAPELLRGLQARLPEKRVVPHSGATESHQRMSWEHMLDSEDRNCCKRLGCAKTLYTAITSVQRHGITIGVCTFNRMSNLSQTACSLFPVHHKIATCHEMYAVAQSRSDAMRFLTFCAEEKIEDVTCMYPTTEEAHSETGDTSCQSGRTGVWLAKDEGTLDNAIDTHAPGMPPVVLAAGFVVGGGGEYFWTPCSVSKDHRTVSDPGQTDLQPAVAGERLATGNCGAIEPEIDSEETLLEADIMSWELRLRTLKQMMHAKKKEAALAQHERAHVVTNKAAARKAASATSCKIRAAHAESERMDTLVESLLDKIDAGNHDLSVAVVAEEEVLQQKSELQCRIDLIKKRLAQIIASLASTTKKKDRTPPKRADKRHPLSLRAQYSLIQKWSAELSETLPIAQAVVSQQQVLSHSIEALEDEIQELAKQKDTITAERARVLQTAVDAINENLRTVHDAATPSRLPFSCMLKFNAVDVTRPVVELLVQRHHSPKWIATSELSGGQRALAALLFCLSINRSFASAIFVLDEVDAALDAEQTKNVAYLLKQSPGATVCISLRRQLFEAAPAIVGVHHQDGASRTVCCNFGSQSADASTGPESGTRLL
ncbi:Mitotic chromosome and X-chromosome-associated protein mix-1 [Diplonema papillatum]|nr:Mitotic chromosome and X-chromosome-associated protein mix-1 [Diplonema papillatum]